MMSYAKLLKLPESPFTLKWIDNHYDDTDSMIQMASS